MKRNNLHGEILAFHRYTIQTQEIIINKIIIKFPNSNNISNEESSPISWPFSQKSEEGHMNSTGVNR